MAHNSIILKICLLVFVLIGALTAQDISLKASVSQNPVSVNQQFQYSVEVSGKSMSLPDIQLPALVDFYVLSGPNTSTSIQLVNGAMTSSKTYTYILRPKKIGTIRIPAASLEDDGKTYSSNEISLKVTQDQAKPKQTPQARTPVTRNDPEISGKDLFLKTIVSKRNSFIGEQIIVEYKLYFKVNIRSYNIDKMPANAGFWTEEFKMPAQPVIENEIVNGVNYNVATIRKIALFPTQSGQLTVEPMQVKLEALVRTQRRRSLFDSFFDDPFGRTVQKKVTSKAVNIKIRDLPEQGKPAGFEGAVGNYKFNVSIDKLKTNVNEAVTLKMSLSGSGNIKLIELPDIKVPPDIEQYDPKISTKINNEGRSISGTKTAEYILIPRIEGKYKIKPINFSFFDPQKKKYVFLNKGPFELKISDSGRRTFAGSGQSNFQNRQEVSLLGRDIRFIKEFSVFHAMNTKVYLSPAYWVFLLTGLILFGGFMVYNDRHARLISDERLARSVKAGKVATRQLAQAKKLLNSEEQSLFYKAVTNALQGFVLDKLAIELTDFSATNIRRVLAERKIDQNIIEEYLEVLQESDFRQFSSSTADKDEKEDIFANSKQVLTKLEKWI